MNAQEVIETLRGDITEDDFLENLETYIPALKDGEALAIMGFTDADAAAVEAAHYDLNQMLIERNKTLKLYFVTGGDAVKINEPREFDGETAIQVIAENKWRALVIAEQFDEGLIQPYNYVIDGIAVVAVKQ